MRVKQVILIRKDLKMRRGKEIAQGAHASIEFLVSQLRGTEDSQGVPIGLNERERLWVDAGMRKICLRVNSEAQLLEAHEKASALGLNSHLIRDSGRTEFGGVPTYTACAIGPDTDERIDSVTGEFVPY